MNSKKGKKFAFLIHPRSLVLLVLFLLLTSILSKANLGGINKTSISRGKKIYVTKCLNCHGPRGKGKTAIGRKMNVGDLSSPMSKDAMIDITISGKGAMPGFSKTLSKRKILDVVNYIQTFSPKARKENK